MTRRGSQANSDLVASSLTREPHPAQHRITQCQTTNINIAGNVTPVQCPGSNTGAIDITVTGGQGPFTYQWSNGATTQDISNLAPGTYTVQVNGSNCLSSGAATFTVGTSADNTQTHNQSLRH